MNGITNYGPVAVAMNTQMPAASRGVLATQGTGVSCTGGLGELLRIRISHQPTVIHSRDESFAAWRPGAVDAAAGFATIDPAAASAIVDKRAESLRKGHPATLIRRPISRPR